MTNLTNVGDRDYLEAKKIVAEYRSFRLYPEKKNAFELSRKLSEVGYTEAEFTKDSNQDAIKNMAIEIREIDSSVVLAEVISAHKRAGNTCLVITQNHPIVYVGTGGFNEKYCKDNSIPINRIGYDGGTIVAGKDDLTLGIILNNSNMLEYFSEKLREWITANYEPAIFTGNDLLIGESKVVGTAIRQTGTKTLYCIQISFSVDLALINNISTKQMDKIPKGLSSFGTKTKEDLIKDIKLWLQ